MVANDHAHIVVMNYAQELLDLMRDLLEDEGYRVSTSLFALDLDRVKALAPDVLVLDIMFQHQLKGWEFLTMARLELALRQVPIILCTAAMSTVREMAEQLAKLKVEVIAKPFEIEQLTDAIEAALPDEKRRRPGE